MRSLMVSVTSTAMIAGCAVANEDGTFLPPVPFEMTVHPSEYFPAIPGQSFVVLVTVGGGEDAVSLEARVEGRAAVEPLRPTIGLEIPSYLDPDSTPIPWDPPTEIDR